MDFLSSGEPNLICTLWSEMSSSASKNVKEDQE